MFGSGLKLPRKISFFFADFALVYPPMASVLLSALVERCFVSRMRDFFTESSHGPIQSISRVVCVSEELDLTMIKKMYVEDIAYEMNKMTVNEDLSFR